MTYPLTFSSSRLPEGTAGQARYPGYILIREGWEGNIGVQKHEERHVLKMLAFTALGLMIGAATIGHFPAFGHWPILWGAIVGSWIYPALRKWRTFRLWDEADAYAEQMKHPNGQGGYLTLDFAAYRLALPMYKLNLTDAEARAAILNA